MVVPCNMTAVLQRKANNKLPAAPPQADSRLANQFSGTGRQSDTHPPKMIAALHGAVFAFCDKVFSP
jgi:hypothetical protein